MWPIIKKNSILFFIYALPILALSTLIWLDDFSSENLAGNSHIVFYFLIWMWIIIPGFAAAGEQLESKDEGYEFLKTLPVTDAEIVAAKFLLTLIMTAACVFLYLVLISFHKAPPPVLRGVRILTIVSGLVCLIVAALMHIGIFKIGITRMNKFLWLDAIAVTVVMVMSIKSLLPRSEAYLFSIIDYMSQIHWFMQLFVVAAVLYCYYLLMKAAVKAKIAAKE